jgi:hypothetical protein
MERHAVYEMFWDPISDWFAEKLQAKDLVTHLLAELKQFSTRATPVPWAAEGVGDVIWPVMLRDAREALRDACIRQIQQMVKDGRAAGIKRPDMKHP